MTTETDVCAICGEPIHFSEKKWYHTATFSVNCYTADGIQRRTYATPPGLGRRWG